MAGRRPNTYFQFKQFTIRQDRCAMKVGTDGVLLGSWVHADEATNILDVGTGTGILALMLAQKSKARIDAVEIDANAALQAMENVAASPWKDRIQVYPQAFQVFADASMNRYDLVVSNPPYFSRSFKPPQPGRILARHNDSLSVRLLVEQTAKLLIPGGRLALVLPYAEAAQCEDEAILSGLYCMRRCVVYPKPGLQAIRVLLELSTIQHRCITEELVIETGTRHAWSDAYIALTRDYYLNF